MQKGLLARIIVFLSHFYFRSVYVLDTISKFPKIIEVINNLYGENYNATKSGNEEYDYSTGTKD